MMDYLIYKRYNSKVVGRNGRYLIIMNISTKQYNIMTNNMELILPEWKDKIEMAPKGDAFIINGTENLLIMQ